MVNFIILQAELLLPSWEANLYMLASDDEMAISVYIQADAVAFDVFKDECHGNSQDSVDSGGTTAQGFWSQLL